MQLKIDNKTTWSTEDLRKIFVLCSKNYAYFPRKIYVVYSKTRRLPFGVGGRGTVGHGWVKMKIPNSIEVMDDKEKLYKRVKLSILEGGYIEKVAQVYIHELGHNLKLRHREMVPSSNINVDFTKGMTVNRVEKKKKKTRTKLSNFNFKGFICKMYKYPHRIKKITYKTRSVKEGNVVSVYTEGVKSEIFGYNYSYLIFNEDKKRVYRNPKIHMENRSKLKEHLRMKINFYIEKRGK